MIRTSKKQTELAQVMRAALITQSELSVFFKNRRETINAWVDGRINKRKMQFVLNVVRLLAQQKLTQHVVNKKNKDTTNSEGR